MLEGKTDPTKNLLLQANPVDDDGVARDLDGPLKCSVTAGPGTFVVQPDGKSIVFDNGGVEADSTFHVEGDADLGEGVVTLAEDVHYVTMNAAPPMAKTLGLTMSEVPRT
jgi:hypothetical protein